MAWDKTNGWNKLLGPQADGLELPLQGHVADHLSPQDVDASTMAQLSIAISLKRIADVAERAEHKLLSSTSREFFRAIVETVMELTASRKANS